MMLRKGLALTVLSFFILLFGFQNCSETPVDLSKTASTNLDYSLIDIQGKLCLEQDYKLVSFFIINMSMKPEFNALKIDSDRDGLSDSFEVSHGFDPSNPRSRGTMLDGICFYLTQSNQCKDLAVLCTGQENEFGISDCDINALNLQIDDTPQLGLDSDDDGIPDKIEVLYELDPASDDALLDYDSDGITNIAETIQGSHPRQEKSTMPQFSDQLVTQKLAPQDTDCMGDEWVFESLNQKIYNLANVAASKDSKNHIWIMALSKKADSTLALSTKLQFIQVPRGVTKEKEILTFLTEDFMTADNNFFRGIGP